MAAYLRSISKTLHNIPWKRLNHPVFWPPFILLIGSAIASLVVPDEFHALVDTANQWLLHQFDWLFSTTSLVMFFLCLAVMFSPIGKWRIGGAEAIPLMNRWRWFSIILCTTVAVGILFWGTAEPLFHLSDPPAGSGIDPMSPEAARFAMGTMFLHWSFTPYAIYTIPALLFALAFYNRKRSFSLGSMLFPVLPNSDRGALSKVINVLCLFALVAGMAASLGAGMLSINGGLGKVLEQSTTPTSLGIIALVIVASFITSSVSGLLKGIRTLSTINLLIFLLLVVFVFVFGPTEAILYYAWEGVNSYVSNFFQQSLSLEPFDNAEWTHSWTTFYWANWMAWAPVTALFLGRIARGYTVREFMLFNWVFPSLFSIVWMSVFSGSVIDQQLSESANLLEQMQANGPQVVMFEMMDHLPLMQITAIVFLFTMFISYVTAADSNTMAMSGLSSSGLSPESPDPPVFIQVVWGVMVGFISWVMVSYAGIDGIKILSNLGGLPAVLLLVGCCIALLWLLIRPGKQEL